VIADLDETVVGEGEPLAASWTSHNQWPSSYAMPRVGLQTTPVVGALREVHSCRLASGEDRVGAAQLAACADVGN
jgi:hypothetical protein